MKLQEKTSSCLIVIFETSQSFSSSSSAQIEPVVGVVVHPPVLNQNVDEVLSEQASESELATSIQNRK